MKSSKVQWFGKSNPLAEVPGQLFYYVQRAREFQVVFLLYQLLTNATHAHAIRSEVRYFRTSNWTFLGSMVPDRWSRETRTLGTRVARFAVFYLGTKFVFSLQATKMKSHTKTRISFELKTGITHCGMTSISSRDHLKKFYK